MYTYMVLCMLCAILISSFSFLLFFFLFLQYFSIPFISMLPVRTLKTQRIKLKGIVEMRSVIFWYKTSHQITASLYLCKAVLSQLWYRLCLQTLFQIWDLIRQ